MLEDATRREQVDLDLLRRVHDHADVRAREELVRRCMPLVRSLARRYVGRGEHLEDLVQVGLIGLVKAIDRFDPDAGTRFVSFASPTITGEIKRHFRDHCWALHVPRSVQELDQRIQAERRQVLADHGREAGPEELARRLGITLEQVREGLQGAHAYRALSLDHPAGEAREMLDTRGGEDPGYARVELDATIQDALGALDERERSVVTWRFHDELLQREIAERIGVSQMQVSRILGRSVERMHEHVSAAAGGTPAALAA